MNSPSPALELMTHRAGAHLEADGIRYGVWAPLQRAMHVVIERNHRTHTLDLTRDDQGFWQGLDPEGRAGDLYRYRLGDNRLLPDPASRFQPHGVHDVSECIDPAAFRWRCRDWERPRWTGQTVYELHVGTFTREGTFRAAIEKLDHLAELGIDAIELMPVADFAGDRNWGYDGVSLYAPARCYGRPDDLRALVDAAHEHDIAVILDVVYNHVGPAGNYLSAFSSDYFHSTKNSPWGQSFWLDGPNSGAVRAFLVDNATYWLDDFRIDGLRLDATHAIPDDSRPHLLEVIAGEIHARGGFVIAEDERNCAGLLRDRDGSGFGLDAVWSDDFHHEVRVALTGTREAYFSAYEGSISTVAGTLEHGWSYRGQPFPFWQGRPRGADCDHLPTGSFVFCIENHDQVGNRAHGERLAHLVKPEQFRAASMLLCLSPYAPMLFMGQEWAASTPFQFFTDHNDDLGRLITEGRRREFEHLHRGITDVPLPQEEATFQRSKLDWDEREQLGHAGTLALYGECLRERRRWLKGAALERGQWQVHSAGAWIAIRYRLPWGERLLLVALQKTEPLGATWPEALRPRSGRHWHIVLHSDAPDTGDGVIDGLELEELAGPCAVWLSEEAHDATD